MRSRWCIIVRIVCSTIGHTARSLAGAGCGKEIRYKRVTRTTTFLSSSNFNFIRIIHIRTEINLNLNVFESRLNSNYTYFRNTYGLWKIWTIKTFLLSSFFLLLLLLLLLLFHHVPFLRFPLLSFFVVAILFFFILFRFLYSRYFSLSFYSLHDYLPPNSSRLCDSSFLLLLSLSLVRSIFFLLHSEEERKKEKKCHCHRSDAFPLKNVRDFYEIFPLYANFGVV